MGRHRLPELVIFDCDGVLVDSEVIFARVLGECLNAVGLPKTSIAQALALGLGKDLRTLPAAIESRFGQSLPSGFIDALRERAAAAFASELQPMPGTGKLLAGLATPCCVASNGHHARVRQRLAIVDLLDFFDPHVFGASQVARGKPAPDVFLFAATRLRTSPEACLVVEDSLAGVAAARAAGMPVVGFYGGSHCPEDHAERLLAAGCRHAFAKMTDLAAFLTEEPCGSSRFPIRI
jgi:HAD superfamily hydrolase (TIGR01509 family)